MRKLIAFPYYGGKFSHLNFILPHLPTDAKHYCEVFGGSAAVLLNRPPAEIETYNDLDSDVCNFFRVLRTCPDALINLIELTPYSREELEEACKVSDEDDSLEKARKFFVRTLQSRNKYGGKSWSCSISDSRQRIATPVSSWLGHPRKLRRVVERLKMVQIENRPAIDILQRYDTEDTLFYVDPPYVPDSRSAKKVYRHEMPEDGHVRLGEILVNLKGRVVLSGYHSDLYDDLFKDWIRVDANAKRVYSSPIKGAMRQESIWLNFEPVKSDDTKQQEMFAC